MANSKFYRKFVAGIGMAPVAIMALVVLMGFIKKLYPPETLSIYIAMSAIPFGAAIVFSLMLWRADLPQGLAISLKCQLLAIKSVFGISVGFLAFLALFSTDDAASNQVMSDALVLALGNSGLFAIPYFVSSYTLYHLEEQ